MDRRGSGGKRRTLWGGDFAGPTLVGATAFVTQNLAGMNSARRDDLHRRLFEHPCGRRIELRAEVAMAMSHDGTRVALACNGASGIRVLDSETLWVVAGRDPRPLVALAWSGDRLATRDDDGDVEIWGRDGKVSKTIGTGFDGDDLWVVLGTTAAR